MKYKNILLFFVNLVFIVSTLFSCSGEKKQQIKAEEEVKKNKGKKVGVKEELKNRPPQIVSLKLDPENPRKGEPVKLLLKYSDPDGDPCSVEFQWFLNGSYYSEARGNTFPQGVFNKGDEIYANVKIKDKKGNAVEARTEPVVVQNSPPRVASYFLSPGNPTIKDNLKISYKLEDPDGDESWAEIEWVINGEIDDEVEDNIYPASKLKPGDEVMVVLKPYDGENYGEEIKTAAIKIQNLPPEFTSFPPSTINTQGDLIKFRVTAKDPESQQVRYSLAGDTSEGITINENTGEITWKIEEKDRGKRFQITILATDESGGKAEQKFEIFIPEKK